MPNSEDLKDAPSSDHHPPVGEGGLQSVLLEHRSVLLRFLTGRLGDAGAAEDVLQNVWIKLQARPASGPIANPLAFLFSICENAARDLRRSEQRRHARENDWAEAQGDGSSANALTPEREAIDRGRLAATVQCLAELPERTRQIFIEFRLEGKSQKDLMETHAISLSAIQKHLQRAYRAIVDFRLREEMDQDDAGKGQP